MIDIRKMSIEDYESTYRLWHAMPGVCLNAIDDSKNGVEKYLARNPTTCFVAAEGGAIVGSVLSGHDGRRGYIYHMAVAVESRRCGIGGALLDASLAALEQEGIYKVALVVLEGNQVGNHFWEAHGFGMRNDLVYRDAILNR